MKILVIANWAQGSGLSGSDRILIELFKRWAKRPGFNARFFISEEALAMFDRHGLGDQDYSVWSPAIFTKLGIFLNGLLRTAEGSLKALLMDLKGAAYTHVYSASDFLPDAMPALILKMRDPKMIWIAGFYLFAPNPFDPDSPYKGMQRIRNFVYYLIQQPVYRLVNAFADLVFVTSEPDVKKFTGKRRSAEKVVVVKGGADLGGIRAYASANKITPVAERKYGACFIGRLHPQKGALELVDIWEMVVKRAPGARLAIIGNGPLEAALRQKIEDKKLRGNIDLFGFRAGNEKIAIFYQSRIAVHPATYDSGGMASIEAMACGLPAVSFDLESLKTYYPKGMLKAGCFDKTAFSDSILRLLSDTELYRKISQDALNLAGEWDWDKRAEEVLCRIEKQS